MNTAPTETSSLTDMFSDTTDKIEAIANATLESGNNVALLAQDNASLREQVSSMQEILSTMQTTISSAPPNNSSHRRNTNSSNRNRARGGGRNRTRTRTPRGFDDNNKHYCHTHGLTRTPYHTSQNCREPDPGHKKEATFGNKMNGSTLKCHLLNSVQDTEEE